MFILPHGDSHERLERKYRHWIRAKQEMIESALQGSKGKKLVRRSLPEFQRLTKELVKKHARYLGVAPRSVGFVEMRSKWASCGPNGRLTLNTMMRRIPKQLIDYVVFHELYHLVERKHNAVFWAGIGRRYKNYRSLEKKLFSYWFLIQKLNNGREHTWTR